MMVAASADIIDSVIIPPCFIGENVVIERSVVGPHVSLGNGTTVTDSIIKNSIIQHSTNIENANFADSMIGSNASIKGLARDLSLGDYSTYSE
jgi:glucose-1-phosphate thymidylyltransferase